MATKSNYVLDHYDLFVKGWIKYFADSQTDDTLYNLSI